LRQAQAETVESFGRGSFFPKADFSEHWFINSTEILLAAIAITSAMLICQVTQSLPFAHHHLMLMLNSASIDVTDQIHTTQASKLVE
jgi:fructose-1,6-bisphosphatase/sedoheptulose 1,7-bisphosphatase-like protein